MIKNIQAIPSHSSLKDSSLMDLIRHIRIYLSLLSAPFTIKKNEVRSADDIKKYWQSPDDGNNRPEQYTAGKSENIGNFIRTNDLVDIIKALDIDNPKILEVGCNAGRNLNGLYEAGYRNLHAIEISQPAIDLFEKTYPETFAASNILCGDAEKILSENFDDNEFDIVFTMAVLQHIHPKSIGNVSKNIFRICKKFLITHEAETHVSWRHFNRSYRVIFSRLGAKFLIRKNGHRVFIIK